MVEQQPDPAVQARTLADEWESLWAKPPFTITTFARATNAPVAASLRAAAMEIERLRTETERQNHLVGIAARDMERLLAEVARLRADRDAAVAAEREACAKIVEGFRINSLLEAEVELANAVYAATGLLEDLELAGQVRGNGHHMRQKVADAAVKILRERWEGDDSCPA